LPFRQLEGAHYARLKKSFIDFISTTQSTNAGEALGLETNGAEVGRGTCESYVTTICSPDSDCRSDSVDRLRLHKRVGSAHTETKMTEVIVGVSDSYTLAGGNCEKLVVITYVGDERFIKNYIVFFLISCICQFEIVFTCSKLKINFNS
jgi:hypothetical protein